MRKRIVPATQERAAGARSDWLDLQRVVEVEMTSEDPEHPIENALIPGREGGWRASGPGAQVIRLLFDEPRPIRRIWLHFEEPRLERTQQLVLRWSPDRGQNMVEVVRQQWNFSPQGATAETEDIVLGVPNVTLLELAIIPDISGGEARASLAQLRVEVSESEPSQAPAAPGARE
ncbi:hypothetical protein TVNIR_0577 [Thioalkalivibrio nitratireducens DSM 14787]|uniref:Carbohydrate-binding protein n=1 Tax=Thioalkalivibrio nitratireducens (strain DSM 14787 / UNIQEM 213 / ALEN2) TaxID=1255043 RepID=L0DTE0_THIND|nr:hypothetical protein [Thioalkalivibrio nitratireducens]AGA32278.1 hypothetical protein TVNIR_0577 [Thioalkalivibrio nitratireducens DSM 14787]